jgi:hypothetical protein
MVGGRPEDSRAISKAPPSRGEGLRIISVDDDHGKATSGNMLLVVWKKLTTAQACMGVTRDLGELARRCPEGVGVLQVLEANATPPDARAREKVLEFLRFCDGRVTHHSLVYGGSGFRAAAVRAIISSFYLAARPRFAHKVFASLPEAVEWHAHCEKKLDPALTMAQLDEHISSLRALVERGVRGP